MIFPALLILSLLSQAFSESSLLCEYTLRSGNYECILAIYNQAGWDNFTQISGRHIDGLQNSDVTVLNSITLSSPNIPRRICLQFNNIQHLTMTGLGIVELTSNSLSVCTRILTFDASNNNIETITDQTFIRFFELQSINLQSNRIKELSDLTFKDNIGLRSLFLQNNPNIRLSPLVFYKMEQLERIFLMNCSLTVWHQSWFNNLRRLQEVDISNNLITSIPDYAFHYISALRSLSFSNNKIANLNREMFGNLNQLSTIRAINNRIYTIDRRIFYDAVDLYAAFFNQNECVDTNINNFWGNFDENMQHFEQCFEGYDNGPWYFITDGINYQWRSISGRGIMISVKAARHAQIIISPTNTGAIPHVETALGLNSNTVSAMFENGVQCTATNCISTQANVINANEYSNFNITWHAANNVIVNREGHQGLWMALVRNLFDVNYFGVGTIDNVGEWIIRRIP